VIAAMLALSLVQSPGAPPAQRYRLEVKTLREFDQTSIGRAKTADGLTTAAFITVAMTDTAGGQIARVTVDSMTLSPSGAVVAELQQHPKAAEKARGAWVRVYVSRGTLAGPAQLSDSTNPALGAIVQAVGVLFPGVRRGAKVGDSWADTSHINNASGARKQSGEVVAAWKVIAMDGDALVLDGTSTTRTKTEDGSGQSMVVSGGTKERVVVPPTGPARRASIETANDMTVTAPSLAAPIPGKTTGTLTLTPLP